MPGRPASEDGTEAGFRIGGTVQKLDVSTYSVPPKSDSDVMAYILFGRPMSQTSGAEGNQASNAAALLGAARAGERIGREAFRRQGGPFQVAPRQSGAADQQLALVGDSQPHARQRDADKRMRTICLDIEVPADFPAKYHGALVRAASQCAVKKTLEDPPEFLIETVVRG